ncbi:hypothetical protein LCGC14_1978760 [marine sediment metagenome]|uniref:Uncharacterized protein n=1 Tax=marine sediment metagenome TaxID=412755 RepID=A0A0F9HMW2_9ZZZZ
MTETLTVRLRAWRERSFYTKDYQGYLTTMGHHGPAVVEALEELMQDIGTGPPAPYLVRTASNAVVTLKLLAEALPKEEKTDDSLSS